VVYAKICEVNLIITRCNRTSALDVIRIAFNLKKKGTSHSTRTSWVQKNSSLPEWNRQKFS